MFYFFKLISIGILILIFYVLQGIIHGNRRILMHFEIDTLTQAHIKTGSAIHVKKNKNRAYSV